MSRKRCWTPLNCELRKDCEYAHIESKNYFQPPHVGEHCMSFKPRDTDYDRHEEVMLAMRMGALS